MGARKDKLFRKLARKFDYAKPYERRMASVIKKVYLALPSKDRKEMCEENLPVIFEKIKNKII